MSRQSAFSFVPRIEVGKIISGGQTGVDRAALDVAMLLGIAQEGFCPLGRRAEDGRIPDRYRLEETASDQYHVRTEMNVVAADGTLILYRETLRGGSQLTQKLARRHGKPCFTVDVNEQGNPAPVAKWLAENAIRTLNVAGPRESQAEGIYFEATKWLTEFLQSIPRVPPLPRSGAESTPDRRQRFFVVLNR